MLEYLAEEGGVALLDVEPGLLIWTLIIFGIVMFVLRTFAWKPIIQALDDRAGKIHEDIDRAEGIRKDAETRLKEYMDKLNGLREEGQEIIAEARRDAEDLKAEILNTAREEAEAVKNRGIRDIQLAKDKALEDYHRQVTELAMSIAAQVLGRAVKPDEHEELIKEAVKGVRDLN